MAEDSPVTDGTAADGPATDGSATDRPAGGADTHRGTGARLRYLFVLSRPRFWLYLAGPVLVGIVYAAESTGDLLAPTAIVLFAYFLVPANVYLYGINDVFDADVDAANPKKEEREVRYGGQRYVLAAVALSGLAALPLFALVDPVAWPWLVGFLVLATAYSAPPIRLKTTPLLDSLSNGLYVLPGAAAYATIAGTQPPLLAVAGGWAWTMAMHTFSAIPDVEPDRRSGIRTTATVLGERRSLAYCGVLWAVAAGAFALYDPRAGAALATYPLLLGGIAVSGVSVSRAYWWYPAVNAAVGGAITLWGLARLVPPETVV